MASLKTIHQRKETLKTILTLVAAALGVMQTSARAAEEPAWSLEGRNISADSWQRRLSLHLRRTAYSWTMPIRRGVAS